MPPTFDPAVSNNGMLIVWMALAVAALLVAIVIATYTRDVLPVAACIGACICSLNEPIFDLLAKLTYGQTPHVAFHAFGRAVPWTALVGYVPWVGLMPYLISRLMAAKVSRGRLHAVAAGLFSSVVLIEILNATWLHDWRYYGQPSWRGVLGGGIIQMAAMPLLAGLLLYVLGEGKSQSTRLLLGIVVPAISLPMIFAGTTWPLYLSNYTAVPSWVAWAAAAVSVGLCVAAVPTITRLAEGWRLFVESQDAVRARRSGAGLSDSGDSAEDSGRLADSVASPST